MKRRADPIDSLNFYKENGYMLVDNLLSPELCDGAIRTAMRLEEAKTSPLSMQPHEREPYFKDLLRHRPLLSRIEKIIGPPIVGLATQFYFCPPGSTGLMRHQDNYCVEAPLEQFASCWIPLVDVDERNGCLSIFPGSHKAGMLPVRSLQVDQIRATYPNMREETIIPQNEKGVLLPAKRGTGIFLHGSVVHESGPNLSDKFRYALLCTYKRKGAPFRPGNTAKRIEIDL